MVSGTQDLKNEEIASHIWQLADILRDNFRSIDYGIVLLPLLVLRRLDCELEPTKKDVIKLLEAKRDTLSTNELHKKLLEKTDPLGFYNKSNLTFTTLLKQPELIGQNFLRFIDGFSEPIVTVFRQSTSSNLMALIHKKEKQSLLLTLVNKLTELDLGKENLTDGEMVLLLEDLLRRIAEQPGDMTSGEHFTPREIIKLMIRLLLAESLPYIDKTESSINILDPAGGTGGILNAFSEELRVRYPQRQILTYGQDISRDVVTIAQLIRLVGNESVENFVAGDSLTADPFAGKDFDLLASNPPFGQNWSHVRSFVEAEYRTPESRFPAGLPRPSDATWLFLQIMLSRMNPKGSRVGVITAGSPWWMGDAESPESEIRRRIIEKDLLETIIALPTNQFYNTGIPTYLCIFSNSKPKRRRGKVQLIDATEIYKKLRLRRGKRRHYLSDDQIETIERVYISFEDGDISYIFKNHDLGYTRISYKRSIYKWDKSGVFGDKKMQRESERISLKADSERYFAGTIRSRYETAVIDPSQTKIGFDIQFSRIFITRRIKAIATKMGFSPKNVREIAEVHLSTTASEEYPNAFYLPITGHSSATAFLSEAPLKPQNYIQIVLDPQIAIAEYVAQFFNTRLGMLIREQNKSGYIPKLSKQTVKHLEIYLPSRELQLEAVRTESQLLEIVNYLQGLRDNLWEEPEALASVSADIKQFSLATDEQSRFEAWFETLPFPLASILWVFHVGGNDEKMRAEHLLHFFEATTQFLATLLLSGIYNDDKLLDEELDVFKDGSEEHSIYTASFGTWKFIFERLSKVVRDLMEKDRMRCETMFRTDNDRVIKTISSLELVNLIGSTNQLRNLWQGHTGIVGKHEAHERLMILQSHLSTLRSIFGNTWEHYELIKPISSIYQHGIHIYQAERLVGSRTLFRAAEYRIEHDLEHLQLHFISPTENRALQLLPFVKVMPSPKTETNACYFYNRVNEDGNLRFVSYHFKQDADTSGPHDDTLSVIEQLLP